MLKGYTLIKSRITEAGDGALVVTRWYRHSTGEIIIRVVTRTP